jgi:dTDP-glucose pyrophosphorylase
VIIIPMAGLSRRFFDAGYERPKYELDLFGRPVFDYAVRSFQSRFGQERFLFIMREDYDAETFVRARLKALGLSNAHLTVLDHQTEGQAHTVQLGLDDAKVAGGEPLTIFNIDSFRPGFSMSPDEYDADGYLEVFEGEGAGWSFVEPGEGQEARRVLEKQRISDLCCTGLYYFARRELFEWAYEEEQRMPSQAIAEHYIAPLYNKLIGTGRRILWRLIPRKQVIFCGTPVEYQALQSDAEPLRTGFGASGV